MEQEQDQEELARDAERKRVERVEKFQVEFRAFLAERVRDLQFDHFTWDMLGDMMYLVCEERSRRAFFLERAANANKMQAARDRQNAALAAKRKGPIVSVRNVRIYMLRKNEGMTLRDLAAKFKLSVEQIRRIVAKEEFEFRKTRRAERKALKLVQQQWSERLAAACLEDVPQGNA